jgi:hypothetical protein
MQKSLRYVGLDVHAETIAVAVAETEGEVRSGCTHSARENKTGAPRSPPVWKDPQPSPRRPPDIGG